VGKQVPGGLYLAAMPVTIRSAAGFKHCGPEGQESKIVEDAMTKSVPDWLRNGALSQRIGAQLLGSSVSFFCSRIWGSCLPR
jgi:hypothetical protein